MPRATGHRPDQSASDRPTMNPGTAVCTTREVINRLPINTGPAQKRTQPTQHSKKMENLNFYDPDLHEIIKRQDGAVRINILPDDEATGKSLPQHHQIRNRRERYDRRHKPGLPDPLHPGTAVCTLPGRSDNRRSTDRKASIPAQCSNEEPLDAIPPRRSVLRKDVELGLH